MVKELNLSPTASQFEGNGFTDRREEHHPETTHWHEWESNPQITEVRTPPEGWSRPLCRFAYRAVFEWPRRDSNPQHLSF